MAKRIAVVGGGITGLAAAFELERATDAEIDLYEESDRLGGKLRTERIGDLLVEHGPDCFFSRKPGVLELVRELGLEGELIEPKAGEFGMLVQGELHRVPRGLVALNAPAPDAIRSATFLSDEAKARALAPQPVGDPDPSIRAFFSARYGDAFSRLVAEPLLAGTHGGDPAHLSMRALYPAYLNPTPAQRGEGGRGERGPSAVDSPAQEAVTPTQPSPLQGEGSGGEGSRATFLSFRDGMETLVDGLARSLTRTNVHRKARLEGLPEADRVLLAIPARHASRYVPHLGLEGIRFRSSAIVTFAFRRADVGRPPEGTGFLVPPSESRAVTGATWSSEKWAGRAPEDVVLMRVFMRPDSDSPLWRNAVAGGNGDEFFEPALRTVGELLGIADRPIYQNLSLWTDALPQYEVGHEERIDGIARRLPTNVFLAGTSYHGVGVPDCLRQGRAAARRIAQTL